MTTAKTPSKRAAAAAPDPLPPAAEDTPSSVEVGSTVVMVNNTPNSVPTTDLETRFRCIDHALRMGQSGAREVVSSAEKFHVWVTDGKDLDATTPTLPGASVEAIARICHEANRAIQTWAGDDVVSPSWADAPDYQRESSMAGVRAAIGGSSPVELHEQWKAAREDDGWTYGDEKNEAAKTHPCLVDYDDLPADQQVKDAVFQAIVAACSGGSTAP